MGTGNPIIVEEDIYDVLSIGGYLTGWNAFIGIMPDDNLGSYSECISINSYSGIGTDTNIYQRPNFQILVRSASYETGREKAQNILDYLMNFDECEQLSFTVNGHHYPLIFPMQTSAEAIGRDERERMIWALNFSAYAEHDDHVVLDAFGAVTFDDDGDVIYDETSEALDK